MAAVASSEAQVIFEKGVKKLHRRIIFQFLFFTFSLGVISIYFTSSQTSMRSELDHRIQEIEMFREQLNITINTFNDTVVKMEDVEQKVQEVNDNVSSQNNLMAYQFAGTFAILGSLISLWHMAGHLQNLHAPEVQRKIIAIMWMIPIYSVSSFLGLVFVQAEAFLSLFKDIYEAYVIYTFLSFLISILGRGDRTAVINLLAKHADHLKPPMRLPFTPKPIYHTAQQKAEAVLDQCQIFSMQFVLLRPITTIGIIISDGFHESRWDPSFPQLYINLVTNISIFFAFTGLLRFYHVVKEDLNWCHPFSKFMSIKGVVFMTFWQGVVISFIAHAVFQGRDDTDVSKDATEWSKEAQSFLICLEMFVFAIVHCSVFPTEEWEPGYREKEKRRIKATFGDSLALKDFVADVKTVIRSRKAKYRRVADRKTLGSEKIDNETSTQSTSLVQDDSQHDDQFQIGEPDGDEEDLSLGWSRIEEFIDEIEGENCENANNFELDRADEERHQII